MMAVTITFFIITNFCCALTVTIITVFTGAGHDLELLNAIATACLRLELCSLVTLLPDLGLSFFVFITFAIFELRSLILDKICS